VNFGSQAVGSTSSAMTVTVTNSTPVPVNISGIAITEAGQSTDFQKTGTTCGATLASSAACTVQVTFSPTVAGPLSASVEVTDDAPGSPQSATLSGTGTAAPVATLSTMTLTFAAQGVGTQSAGQMVTLTNTGTAIMNIEGISITGPNLADFAQTNTCGATVAASANCTITVKFTPSAGGSRAASLTIDDDAPGNPHSVALAGTGQAQPTATPSANMLTFVATVSGSSSASQMVTVTNNGGAALTITSIALSGANPGDFLSTNTCGASLAASANCTITVTFKPTAGGARAAAVTLTDNAADSPQSVALAGTGEDFTLSVTTPTQTISRGGTANIQVDVTPQGGFAGLITLTCTGAPVHSTCSVTPSSFTATVTPTNVAVSLVTQGQMFVPAPFSPRRWPARRLFVYPLAICVSLLALFLMAASRQRDISFKWMGDARSAMVLALILVGVFGLAGCGSTSGVARGNVNLTITAASGGISHGAPITVIVQ
jgi:trimeric autotransporter adhesin